MYIPANTRLGAPRSFDLQKQAGQKGLTFVCHPMSSLSSWPSILPWWYLSSPTSWSSSNSLSPPPHYQQPRVINIIINVFLITINIIMIIISVSICRSSSALSKPDIILYIIYFSYSLCRSSSLSATQIKEQLQERFSCDERKWIPRYLHVRPVDDSEYVYWSHNNRR